MRHRGVVWQRRECGCFRHTDGVIKETDHCAVQTAALVRPIVGPIGRGAGTQGAEGGLRLRDASALVIGSGQREEAIDLVKWRLQRAVRHLRCARGWRNLSSVFMQEADSQAEPALYRHVLELVQRTCGVYSRKSGCLLGS